MLYCQSCFSKRSPNIKYFYEDDEAKEHAEKSGHILIAGNRRQDKVDQVKRKEKLLIVKAIKDTKQFYCDICKQAFSSAWHLKTHNAFRHKEI